MQKTLLITGGTGYIGSHGVVAFEKAGYKIVIVDNLINSNIEALDGIKNILSYKPDFYKIDLRDNEGLEKVFKKYNFDGVIHFAGLKSPFESQTFVEEYHSNNISGSIVLFSLMKSYNVNKIIFSSSANIYSNKNESPIKENGELKPNNPYGRTKFIIENILEDFALYSGFKVFSLRYFNPIGAHSSGFIGENPNGTPNNLLPYILDVAIGRRDKLYVFGDDYQTIDGTGVRDYIDVNDLINAHLRAFEKIDSFSGFTALNVGNGEGKSVLEMIKLVEKSLNISIKYSIEKRRPGDIGIAYADPSKIKDLLGWEAVISLEDSIINSWKFNKYMKKNLYYS